MPTDPSIPESPEPLSAFLVAHVERLKDLGRYMLNHTADTADYAEIGRLIAEAINDYPEIRRRIPSLDRGRASRVTPNVDTEPVRREVMRVVKRWDMGPEQAAQVIEAVQRGLSPASRVTQPTVAALAEAIRDFVSLLPPERWWLLRDETQATVDRLAALPVQEATPTPVDTRLRAALGQAADAMDIIRDGLGVKDKAAIVVGAESILRHAAREARRTLDETATPEPSALSEEPKG